MKYCSFSTGIEVSPKFYILRLDRYANGFMHFVMAMEFITICFVIFFTVREFKKLRQDGRNYFKVNVFANRVCLLVLLLFLFFFFSNIVGWCC